MNVGRQQRLLPLPWHRQLPRFTHEERGWLYGVWYCGTSFQRGRIYGAYPGNFVQRVLHLIPPDGLLHLCCGEAHIPGAVNLDVQPRRAADILADVEQLPFAAASFSNALIDPPYSEEDATRYGQRRGAPGAAAGRQPALARREISRLRGRAMGALWAHCRSDRLSAPDARAGIPAAKRGRPTMNEAIIPLHEYEMRQGIRLGRGTEVRLLCRRCGLMLADWSEPPTLDLVIRTAREHELSAHPRAPQYSRPAGGRP